MGGDGHAVQALAVARANLCAKRHNERCAPPKRQSMAARDCIRTGGSTAEDVTMTQRPTRRPAVRSTRVAVAMLAAAFSFAPIVALAADSEAHESRAELRIKDLHGRLKILPAQEAQWTTVAGIMRDNAMTMDKLTQARVDHAAEASAVDDLTSYGEISAAHAEGIRKLTPAFAALYGAMSDTQKKQADLLFREGERAQGGNEAVTQTPTAK